MGDHQERKSPDGVAAGFKLSPAVEKAVDQLLEIGVAEALSNVELCAIFSGDLSEVRRLIGAEHRGQSSAEVEARCDVEDDEVFAQVPHPTDSRHSCRSFLIAGIVWKAEEARNMYTSLRECDVEEAILRGYEETERRMLAHIFYSEPPGDEQLIEIGRWERNQLAGILAQRMQDAGETLVRQFKGHNSKEAKAGAATIVSLAPLRDAIGWGEKVSKKKAKKDARWFVPVGLVLEHLPPIQEELRESFSSLLKATEEQEANGEPGFSRESMGHASNDLDVVTNLLWSAREQLAEGRS